MKQLIVITILFSAWQLCSCYSSFFSPSSTLSSSISPSTSTSSSTYPTEEDVECQQAGLMCRNCEELVNCIEIGPGEFIQVNVKNCDNNELEFCLIDECSTAPNPTCTLQGAEEFLCHNTGVYPDPSDCRIYHMCVEPRHNIGLTTPADPIHIPVQCDEGYGYNPVTTYCDTRLQNNLCTETPVDVCTVLGQMGPVNDTSIFYVCMEEDAILIPHLYMCPAGGRFHNGVCNESDY